MKRRESGEPKKSAIGKEFSLSLTQVTVRQALNKIAEQDGARFWIFERDRSGTFFVSNSTDWRQSLQETSVPLSSQ